MSNGLSVWKEWGRLLRLSDIGAAFGPPLSLSGRCV